MKKYYFNLSCNDWEYVSEIVVTAKSKPIIEKREDDECGYVYVLKFDGIEIQFDEEVKFQ